MAERKMSPKGFLHKTTTKAANSAAAFLSQYREYLVTGELAPITSPIIHKLDTGALLPTPALREISHAVMMHIIESDKQKMEKAIEAAVEEPKQPKHWIARICDAQGNICTRVNSDGEEEELVKEFDMGQDADRWVDLRLFDGCPDWYGTVDHTMAPIQNIILRADAIARILKVKKGPAIQQKGMSTRNLGFGVKVKESRASFSRG